MTNPSPIDNLMALARKATPGPWGNRGRLSDRIVDSEGKTIAECCGEKLGPDGDEQDEANGIYITAASPDAIIEMGERIERLEVALKEIAKQKLINEFHPDSYIVKNGDFEGAYEIMIKRARAALQPKE